MSDKSSLGARVLANLVIGTIAGTLPPIAWYAWIEWTKGFRDGLGGLAWLAALGSAAIMAGLAGAILGAAGQGVRTVGLRDVVLVLLGACAGAVLGALAGQLAVGLGNEQSVAGVLLSETVGVILGMLVPTTLRAAS